MKLTTRYSSAKSWQPKVSKMTAKSFQNFHECSSNGPHQARLWILSFRFLAFCVENVKFIIVPNGESKPQNYLENEQSQTKMGWTLRVVEHIWDTFGLAAFKVIFGVFGELAILAKIRFSKCFFYAYDSLQPNLLQLFLLTVHIKVAFVRLIFKI